MEISLHALPGYSLRTWRYDPALGGKLKACRAGRATPRLHRVTLGAQDAILPHNGYPQSSLTGKYGTGPVVGTYSKPRPNGSSCRTLVQSIPSAE